MDSDINREHGSKDSKVKGDERKWHLNDKSLSAMTCSICKKIFNIEFNIEFNQN